MEIKYIPIKEYKKRSRDVINGIITILWIAIWAMLSGFAGGILGYFFINVL